MQASDPLEKTISAAAKVRPAVVSIINEQVLLRIRWGRSRSAGSGDGSGALREAALGSGVIFDKVDGKAHYYYELSCGRGCAFGENVLITERSGRRSIIGNDEITDLAVLEIDDKGIDTVASFGDSYELRAAEWVMAIGNPLGLGIPVSSGIVSKRNGLFRYR